ncbi:MAG: serine/threonine protein kinase [Labilithrix sp.]|nr:serine/threonine protein kinase [Labilithrix sp.]
MSLVLGQIIDAKYRVVRLIGEGGMGTVYEGENSRIGKRVAIKVLHAQVAAMPDFVERFEREARAAARIGSPHVCDVLDLGDLPSGDRYIVMEYLEGVSFEDRLVERKKLTPAQLAPIAFELLEGLGTMHAARVIHRDLKPANVFLSRVSGGRGEVVKILDFGVAKLLPFAGEVGTMTQTGTMMGTPLYMSPEQARGARDVDARTDIYAASVMFYRALAGVLPYNADTLNELLFKIVLEDPKPLRELAPEVDEVFAGIIHKGLARDIAQRYESARAYQEAIAAWGKAQGRTSLSFAVTYPSEPPPTPITLPEAAAAQPGSAAASAGPAAGVAVAVTAAPVTAANGGTPIAWSEDGPDSASSAKRSAETVLTPVGSSVPSTSTSPVPIVSGVASAAKASLPDAATGSNGAISAARASDTEPAQSGATLASASSSSATSKAKPPVTDEIVVAQATTAPGSPLPTHPGNAAKNAANSASARSPRGLIAGIVGVGAVAVIGLLAFGRGSGDKQPGAGLTPITSAVPSAENAGAGATGARPAAVSDVASAAPSSSSAGWPTSTASSASSASSASGASSATDAARVTAPTQAPKHDAPPIAGGTARKPDPTTKPVTGTASTPPVMPGATPSAPATTPGTAATTPKPAGSARKFRTNLD